MLIGSVLAGHSFYSILSSKEQVLKEYSPENEDSVIIYTPSHTLRRSFFNKNSKGKKNMNVPVSLFHALKMNGE